MHNKPENHYSLIQKILKKYKKFPAHVCELGIQDDALIKLFAEQHQICGVTPDKDLAQELKNTVSQAKIYGQSLSSFRVPVQMGLCMMRGQQIHTVRNWEKFFQKVADHMEPYGLFVFDIYSPEYFESKNKTDQDLDISTESVCISSRKKKKDVYQHIYTRFDEQSEGMYSRTDETQTYISHSLAQSKKLLRGAFESVEFVDPKGRKVNTKTKHIYVVCQKGW